LSHGVPQGYFGFNESHGLYLSFAAWSPILLLGWVLYGVVLGWNLLSPVWANLLMMSLAMFAFGLLVKPDKKQMAWISGLYISFIPVTRFVLSCIPEAELFALFIVFWGLALNSRQYWKRYKIAWMFFLIMLMTWMRPYLILLFMTPIWIWSEHSDKTRKQRTKIGATSTGVCVFTLGVYVLINHFFSAPYLTDLFYTEWIGKYFEEGFIAGLKYTVWKLLTSFRSVGDIIWQNMKAPENATSAAGLYYALFLAMLVLLMWKLILHIWKRDVSIGKLLPELQMFLCMTGFFAADLLMYRLHEGGRHTLVYLVGMIFLLPFMWNGDDKKSVGVMGFTVVCCLLLFVGRGAVPYEFSIPYGTVEQEEDLESLSRQLSENMVLSEDGIGYDNTIIWTLWDSKGQDKTKAEAVDFGAYYAVPKGFGINLCDGGYMDVNLENLQSRYIGTMPGGAFAKRCEDAGGVLIGQSKRLVVYDMAATP